MTTSLVNALRILACALIPMVSWAAPGEDPIVLTKPVEHLQLPVNSGLPTAQASTGDMPTNVKAKIARLEAKSFSDVTDGIYSDADVKTTIATAGQQKKSCIQDVGSNTSTNGALRFGPGNNKQQIVVLRGDLVNICN